MTNPLPAPTDLASHHCVPCEGGTQPLTRAEFTPYLDPIPDWSVEDGDTAITRTIVFKDFMEVIRFITQVAALAEDEGHHPDLHLHDYKKLSIRLTTHAIGGLSVNDFVMAIKSDELYNQGYVAQS